MSSLPISEELTQEIRSEAKTRGMDVEDFLHAVLRRERTLADRRKIEEEQEWWLSCSLNERAQYEGKSVAIHNRAVVDSDTDETALYQRVRVQYGKAAVLIMPAEGPREIHILSPRLVRE
ncbi:MAG: hypothetical protein HY327_02545 [Chloroflexi bacterium]|nr:hypothetical protein [Chloroflexota bacterium]